METKKTLAIYRSVDSNFNSVQECEDWIEKDTSDYIRVTDPVDIEFIPITDATIVNKTIEALQTKKQTVLADAQLKVNSLEEQIQELLAIPFLADEDKDTPNE